MAPSTSPTILSTQENSAVRYLAIGGGSMGNRRLHDLFHLSPGRVAWQEAQSAWGGLSGRLYPWGISRGRGERTSPATMRGRSPIDLRLDCMDFPVAINAQAPISRKTNFPSKTDLT